MADRRSAGILAFRLRPEGPEVFLVHPGGPFWAAKDVGAWSIPKGLADQDEDELAAALREFTEETGFRVQGPYVHLGEIRQPSGKIVRVWAVQASFDPSLLHSNTFPLEWPPRSGKTVDIPEVDRGEWFSLPEAGTKITKGQSGFLTRLVEHLRQSQEGEA
jgi:predicted NUDIX family NTP pyrophosphohydrolase